MFDAKSRRNSAELLQNRRLVPVSPVQKWFTINLIFKIYFVCLFVCFTNIFWCRVVLLRYCTLYTVHNAARDAEAPPDRAMCVREYMRVYFVRCPRFRVRGDSTAQIPHPNAV